MWDARFESIRDGKLNELVIFSAMVRTDPSKRHEYVDIIQHLARDLDVLDALQSERPVPRSEPIMSTLYRGRLSKYEALDEYVLDECRGTEREMINPPERIGAPERLPSATEHARIESPAVQQSIKAPEVPKRIEPPVVAQTLKAPEVPQKIEPPVAQQSIESPEVPHKLEAAKESVRIEPPEETVKNEAPSEQTRIEPPVAAQTLKAPEVPQRIKSPVAQQSIESPEIPQKLVAPKESVRIEPPEETVKIEAPAEQTKIEAPEESKRIGAPQEQIKIEAPVDPDSTFELIVSVEDAVTLKKVKEMKDYKIDYFIDEELIGHTKDEACEEIISFLKTDIALINKILNINITSKASITEGLEGIIKFVNEADEPSYQKVYLNSLNLSEKALEGEYNNVLWRLEKVINERYPGLISGSESVFFQD